MKTVVMNVVPVGVNSTKVSCSSPWITSKSVDPTLPINRAFLFLRSIPSIWNDNPSFRAITGTGVSSFQVTRVLISKVHFITLDCYEGLAIGGLSRQHSCEKD